jgi:hypothetical protein
MSETKCFGELLTILLVYGVINKLIGEEQWRYVITHDPAIARRPVGAYRIISTQVKFIEKMVLRHA